MGARISELRKRLLATSWGVSDELLELLGGGRGGFWRECGDNESFTSVWGESVVDSSLMIDDFC